MWFRITGRILQLRWSSNEMLLSIREPGPITTSISEGSRYEEEPNSRTNASVSVVYEAKVSPALEEQACEVVDHRQLESFTVEPHNVQAEIREIRTLMTQQCIRTINLIRWSLGRVGPAFPLEDVEFAYSIDNVQWSVVSAFPLFRKRNNHPVGNQPLWQAELQAKLDQGESEPICHDIYRAAWESRFANPRAALTLGVAALEVGTKECIARLVPETSWLVENIPSPPIDKLIGKFIPLILKNRGNLSIFAPPSPYVRNMQKLVETRNTLAHKFEVTD